MALEKFLKPWVGLFSTNEAGKGVRWELGYCLGMFGGGRTKVEGLKRILEELFIGKLTVDFSCAPTGITIAIGIQDHGLNIGLWVSWLKVRPNKIFLGLIYIQNGLFEGAISYTKNKFSGPNGI